LTEETILSAEAELQAAMAAKDPERLKRAIANASEAVARARAKNSHVLKKANIIKGGEGDGANPKPRPRTSVVVKPPTTEVTQEEKRYIEFHELATQRKLNLASRGFEVQNIFIDDLYEEAADVPQADWHEFIRLQLPSPRGVDSDGSILWEDSSAKLEAETKLSPWKKRVLAMMKKKHQGQGNAIVQAAHALIERPEGMVDSDTLGELTGPANPKFNAGLDAHMASLHLIDAPEYYKSGAPGSARSDRSDASRGKRYSQAVRTRMEERQKAKPADVN